jgi:cytochrome oxidase Cu insertion factor (SCO1/SenC/PrrC family)
MLQEITVDPENDLCKIFLKIVLISIYKHSWSSWGLPPFKKIHK